MERNGGKSQGRAARNAVLCAIVLFTGLARASDPPASLLNPVTGHIEIADTVWSGADNNVRHVVNPGGGQPLQVTTLTTNAADDLAPRIAASPSGSVWVTWYRTVTPAQIVSRKRSAANNTWAAEKLISDAGEDSRAPSIAHDGAGPWWAWLVSANGQTQIAVTGGGDTPDPEPTRSIVGTTSFAGTVDPVILYESAHLWITWVDSASNVGWVTYDYTQHAWSGVGHESYGNDSVTAARARIRTQVLGN